MVVRATLGGAILVGMMGFVQNVEQLVVLRLLQGTVTGIVAAATALVAASVPREQTGEALGLLQMARWGGVAIGPVIGGIIGDAIGFRESFWMTGTLLGLSGICAMLWVHEDFTPIVREKRTSMFAGYRQLLRAPGIGGLYELNFLRSLAQTMILPILALFVVQLADSEAFAASYTGLMIGGAALAGAISSVWLGRLGDRIGHGRILIWSAVAAMLLFIPQPFVTKVWQLMVLQALGGFATGGLIPSIASLMNLWAPSGNQGSVYGLDSSIVAAARSVAPMFGAGVAFWFGMRGVFGMTAIVYSVIVLAAIYVLRKAEVEPCQASPFTAIGASSGD